MNTYPREATLAEKNKLIEWFPKLKDDFDTKNIIVFLD